MNIRCKLLCLFLGLLSIAALTFSVMADTPASGEPPLLILPAPSVGAEASASDGASAEDVFSDAKDALQETGTALWDRIKATAERFSVKLFLSELEGTSFERFRARHALIALLALFACFFAYRAVKLFVSIGGFFAGGIGAYMLCDVLVPKSFDYWQLAYGLAALLVAALFAYLSFRMIRVGTFFFAFGIGYAFFSVLGHGILPTMVFAALIGLAGVFLLKPVVIVGSALFGGVTLGFLLGGLLCAYLPLPYISYLFSFLLFAFGLIFQYGTAERSRKF